MLLPGVRCPRTTLPKLVTARSWVSDENPIPTPMPFLQDEDMSHCCGLCASILMPTCSARGVQRARRLAVSNKVLLLAHQYGQGADLLLCRWCPEMDEACFVGEWAYRTRRYNLKELLLAQNTLHVQSRPPCSTQGTVSMLHDDEDHAKACHTAAMEEE